MSAAAGRKDCTPISVAEYHFPARTESKLGSQGQNMSAAPQKWRKSRKKTTGEDAGRVPGKEVGI
jgi:hypothetical protein